jgi:hypothetical protein
MVPTPEQAAELQANDAGPDSLTAIAFSAGAKPLVDLVDLVNSRTTRALSPASVGGVASARGLAGMYAAAVAGLDGGAPLLKPETLAEFGRTHLRGTDVVTGTVDGFALGFERMRQAYPFLGEGSIGHSGAAGSQSFADPVNGVAYGYTRRTWAYPGGAAPENARLAEAVTRAAAAVR